MSTENQENKPQEEIRGTNTSGPRGNSQILNAFKQEFSTTVNVVMAERDDRPSPTAIFVRTPGAR